ncbi:MAG TPA: hypothetical protein VGE07_03985 [Herpetosiphonaceae bacterium]
MRFPGLERVGLPARLAEIQPGRLHPDGRRYLPLLVLEIDGQLLGVTDRHHRVDSGALGATGTARLVFHLSRLRLQPAGARREGLAQPGAGLMLAPTAWGRISEVLAWEQHRKLGYDSLYTELLIDIGLGAIGLRTNVTGESLAVQLGAERLAAGDWVVLEQSRIDILAFEPAGRTP